LIADFSNKSEIFLGKEIFFGALNIFVVVHHTANVGKKMEEFSGVCTL
jgi:hypothetical protein